jgi:hypothetical protein
MIRRFNGRIADVLRSHRVQSGLDLKQTLLWYASLHNHQMPQSALKSRIPTQAMRDWHADQSELFIKLTYDCSGYSTVHVIG